VDNNGDVQNHRVYDPWGSLVCETAAAVTSPFGFTGREIDEESTLQYNRARYYDSATGRWISEDPIGFSAGDTHLTRYVMNRPVNYVDPLGLFQQQYSDPVTHAPAGAPTRVQVAIGDLYSNPHVMERLKEVAKEAAGGNERGGFIVWDTAKDDHAVFESDSTRNTPERTYRTWFPKDRSKDPGPVDGNPPDKDGKPIRHQVIFYGWHTHPTGKDAWPSRDDRRDATKDKLVEIVVYYYELAGKPIWKWHIVDIDGKYYEWVPPATK
jgi:RHS repeat-associated protein